MLFGGTGVLVRGTGVLVGGTAVLMAAGAGCSDEGSSPPQASKAKRTKKTGKRRSRFMARILIDQIVQLGSFIIRFHPSPGNKRRRPGRGGPTSLTHNAVAVAVSHILIRRMTARHRRDAVRSRLGARDAAVAVVVVAP